MPVKQIKKIEIRKGHSAGMGFLPWRLFEQRLREIDVLTDKQSLKTIYLDNEGIYFTTKKTKNK